MEKTQGKEITTKIYRSVFTASVLVITIVLLTFYLTNNLLTSINRKYTADPKIEYARHIISELYLVDNSFQSYLITLDSFYYRSYHKSAIKIKDKLNYLKQESKTDTIWQKATDSLMVLMSNKLQIAEKLMALKSGEKPGIILDKFEQRVIKDNNISPEKPNSWWNLKKSNSNRSKLPSNISKQELKEQSEALKKEENIRLRALSLREKDLNKRNTELSHFFHLITNELEAYHYTQTALHAASSSASAKNIVYLLAFFCFASLGFLVLLYKTIQKYTKQNTLYKIALNKAKDEAVRLSKAKEVFISNMSHEIRTPLHAIIGFTNQLAQNEQNEKKTEQLSIIKNASNHLLVIINDILDFSKIVSGKIKLTEEPFSINSLLDEITHLLLPKAKSKGLMFFNTIDKDVPKELIGDHNRLRQILINLIGNALKFTTNGQVKVDVRGKLLTSNKYQLTIDVIDTGIGIAKENQERIFEDFMQADHTIERNYGGSGLGLPIVKELLKQLNGTLSLVSELDKGSTFTVCITFATAKSVTKKTATKASINKTLPKNLRVLIADDEPYNLKLIEAILQKYKPTIYLAENGTALLQILNTQTIDIVLTDIRMPGLTGITIAKRIRKLKDPIKSTVPIIALTAATTMDEKDTCLAAGMNGFLSKPFAEDELIETMIQVLQKPSLNINNEHTNNAINSPNEIDKIAKDNPQFAIQMLQLYIKNSRETIAQIQEAIKEKAWAKAGFLAHRLAAPARHIGQKDFSMKLKLLEELAPNNLDPELIINLANEIQEENEIVIISIENKIKKYSLSPKTTIIS